MAGKEAAVAAAPVAATPEPAPAGKKKRVLMLAAIGAVVVIAAGAGLFMMLGGKKDKAPAAEVRKLPTFVDLEAFTVNLRSADKENEPERFMQVKLVAEVKDAPSGEALKSMMPAVRNEILLLLGSKQADQVASREGKEQLAREIVAAANKPLTGTPAAGSVEGVNFTHLIIQ
jgi:flagellar FliL protein